MEFDCWKTLGVVRYRNGDFQEAIDALEKSVELAVKKGEISFLFLAMAHLQLGDKDQSQLLYKKSIESREPKSFDPKALERFRSEAMELFAIP